MSSQAYSIQSCHTISSITKSRFGALITQLSKKARVLRNIDQDPSYYKWHLNFPSQGKLIPLHSFPSNSKERKNRGGVYSGQNLTQARIKTCVPRHQNFPMTLARKTSKQRQRPEHSRDHSLLPRKLIVPRKFILPKSVIPTWARQYLQLTRSNFVYICGVC